MTHPTILLILFGAFFVPTINAQCPTGKSSTQKCDLTALCPSDQQCYRRNGSSFCCGELDTFCPTKMHAFNSIDAKGAYLYEFGVSLNNTQWYNFTLTADSVACPIPSSFTYSKWVQLLPVDFDATKPESSIPKACKTNADCKADNEEFCGPAFHPTFDDQLDKSGVNKAPLSFCYKFQNAQNTKIKPFIKPDAKGLIGCNSDSECFTSHGSDKFCFQNKIVRFVDNSGNATNMKGVCAIAHACDATNHVQVVASLSKDNKFCKANEDCQESGIAKGKPGMEPACVEVPGLANTTDGAPKMCCFKPNKACIIGTVLTPVKTCATFKECNSDEKELYLNKWCDEKEKHCCRDLQNRLWMCPDGATPLFNEPKCNGYDGVDVTSGTCPNNAGICKYGHCCPPLRSDSNRTLVGQKPYVTNFDCKPELALPKQFNYAFCDPENKKIVIMGEKHVGGEAIVKEGTKCSTNKECKEGHICVTESQGERSCFFNPLKKVKAEASSFWLYSLITSLVLTCVFMCTSIVCLVCYRSKSVFDKYVPKKKNKKKKGKGLSSRKSDTSTKTSGNETASEMK